MPASLLVEQRKMIFYNKTSHSNNIVLRILCALHRNEAHKLSSMYHIFPGHSSSIDIKRAVWSLAVYFVVLYFCMFLLCTCLLYFLLLCCLI